MKSDGGPAFPVECYFNESGVVQGIQTGNSSGFHTGLSLRDYFAAAALTGLIINNLGGKIPVDYDARVAYEYADEMLKARETVPEK